jgi:hypothetical protein
MIVAMAEKKGPVLTRYAESVIRELRRSAHTSGIVLVLTPRCPTSQSPSVTSQSPLCDLPLSRYPTPCTVSSNFGSPDSPNFLRNCTIT